MKISDLMGKLVRIKSASSFNIVLETLYEPFDESPHFKFRIEPLEDGQEIRVWKTEVSRPELLDKEEGPKEGI